MYPEPGRYTSRGGMDPGEQSTGTRDEHYNLVSVLYHALHGAENCAIYALDAEAAGRDDLLTFFREAQVVQAGLAEGTKELLGIGGVVPEPGGAAMPGTAEVGTAVPPEGIEEEIVSPAPPSAEEVSPMEQPPPGEERPERRGVTPTSPPSPREAPPPGEERPGRR